MALFSLRIISSDPDLTSYELFQAGAQGIEERANPSGAELILYSDQEAELLGLLDQLDSSHIIRFRVVPEQDGWETAWGANLRPIELCRGYWVKPTTAQEHGPSNVQLIHLEPDLVFGIGSHATTQLAAAALVNLGKQAKRVLDVGTGTGVLALLAKLLGATDVLALDNDPRALRSAQRNLGLNPKCGSIRFSDTSVENLAATESEEETQPSEPWDVVVANIETPVLLDLAEPLTQLSRGAQSLILTGILYDRLDEVLRRYQALGARVQGIREQEDWRLLVLKPPALVDAGA